MTCPHCHRPGRFIGLWLCMKVVIGKRYACDNPACRFKYESWHPGERVKGITVASSQIIQGDCLEVLRTLPAGSVDAVITDPPYGMAWDTDSTRFTGEQHQRGDGRDDWGKVESDDKPFDPAPWLQFPKVVLFGMNHYAARLPVGTTLVWIKRDDHLFGSFLSDAELAWMKGGYGVYCFRKQFPPPSRQSESGVGRCVHPCQKPISLMRWVMDRAGIPEGATVLDPYMGSGTTGVACALTGRNFIGIEIDPRYCEIARRRIAEACPLFAGGN